MIKVLTAALLGTIIGVVVMVAVIAVYGTDTSDSSTVGLGSLPISTYSAGGSSSAPSSTPTSTPSSSEGGSTSTPTSSGSSGDVANGQTLFQANCSGCHVVEPGAQATVGPNLADLAPSLDEETILNQIKNGGGPMPAGLVSGQDAVDVAAYILSLAQ